MRELCEMINGVWDRNYYTKSIWSSIQRYDSLMSSAKHEVGERPRRSPFPSQAKLGFHSSQKLSDLQAAEFGQIYIAASQRETPDGGGVFNRVF